MSCSYFIDSECFTNVASKETDGIIAWFYKFKFSIYIQGMQNENKNSHLFQILRQHLKKMFFDFNYKLMAEFNYSQILGTVTTYLIIMVQLDDYKSGKENN